jgi:hypothetical protein
MSTPVTVHFNVGGTHYEVSRSLIESFPDTMLARICSETWQKDDEDGNEPIFIDRDSERFRYVLDYMRDTKVSLPLSISKEAFLRDLQYFGFNVDSDAINADYARDDARKHLGVVVSGVVEEKDTRLEKLSSTASECERTQRCLRVAHKCFVQYCEMGSLLLRFQSHLRVEACAVFSADGDLPELNECLARYGLRCNSKNEIACWNKSVKIWEVELVTL